MGKWFGIIGETDANADGRSRQTEIAACAVGEPIGLRHEPDDHRDPNCIKVLSTRGVPLGRLSREHAAAIAPHLRAGHSVEGRIARIDGGTPVRPMRSVIIDLNIDDADFEKALAHVRRHGLAGRRFHTPPTHPSEALPPALTWAAGAVVLLALTRCGS